jgi:hypothetical protein
MGERIVGVFDRFNSLECPWAIITSEGLHDRSTEKGLDALSSYDRGFLMQKPRSEELIAAEYSKHKHLWTASQLASQIPLDADVIQRYAKAGAIPYVKITDYEIYFDPKQIMKWIYSRNEV